MKDIKSESGIVSIMVTMVMLIVISLIVLGLAEISQTEQRNTTDSQLSDQAFYSAESGVNDAVTAIESLVSSGQTVPAKLSCTNSSSPPYNFTGIVNTVYNDYYTCLTINPSPSTLSYPVNTQSTVIPLTSSSAINSITLTWTTPTGLGAGNCNITKDHFVPANPISNWPCNFPVLRVDLLDANGQLERNVSSTTNDWSTDTATMFFMPTFGSADPNPSLNERGTVVEAHCTQTINPQPTCSATINLSGGTSYYMRETALYKSGSSLTVTANGGAVSFNGVQVVIDSTGKAQDILKRIRVAVDLTAANANILPSGALISEDSVCKEYSVSGSLFSMTNSGIAGSDGDTLCSPH